MQVASSSALSSQLQALGIAALNQYQANGDFSFTVGGASANGDGGGASAGSSATGPAMTGSFSGASLIAVGTMSNGQLDPFSPQQIQSEEDMVANMRQQSFADSLQNFLNLSQASSPDGQIAASSYSDQQSFTGDNGLVSVAFNASYSLDPSGAGLPDSPPGTMQSITA